MDQPIQKRVLKACDACKRRKVKCNGQERCQQCAHLGLRCVYSKTGKQRSQGKRGHVISEFRNQTANASAISPPLLPAITQASFQAPCEDIAQSTKSNGSDPSMSAMRMKSLIRAAVERAFSLTNTSVSGITNTVTIQQTVLSEPHPRLLGKRLSSSSNRYRT